MDVFPGGPFGASRKQQMREATRGVRRWARHVLVSSGREDVVLSSWHQCTSPVTPSVGYSLLYYDESMMLHTIIPVVKVLVQREKKSQKAKISAR